MKTVIPAFLLMIFCLAGRSQSTLSNKIWQQIPESAVKEAGKRFTFPSKYTTLSLDSIAMRNLLATAPAESALTAVFSAALTIEIPTPGGSFQRFRIVEYNVLHPLLAAKFPDIKTYTGQGIDDPSAIIKLDMTTLGFHAMVLSPGGQFFIDPYAQDATRHYICYDKKDLKPSGPFQCEVTGGFDVNANQLKSLNSLRTSGTQLRTYRLALACTGEYAATKGGTVSGALSGMTTSMNRVNGVYETEVAIRMVIIANNNLVVYTNASTDPYTNNNGSTMLGENASNLNTVIGAANFDIGHVFSTGGGGIAALNGPCGSNKARGVTGSTNPVGDAYDIDYVAHEMGHQFGGNHTFNSVTGNCSGNRNASTAYEPGSGVTIQAYAGICGTDDVAPNSIAYFHTISFDEIIIFSQTGAGNGCPVITNTGNTAPVVTTMGTAVSIPVSTAFELTGAATDANADPLTYCWEEFDLGPAGAWNVQSTTAPMFRTFAPVTSPSRTFPRLSDILNNTTTIGELLPNQARTLKFRLTARDNRSGGGGVMHPDATLNIAVVNNGGAFQITAPNTAVTWPGNSTQTVTWNVSGTTNSPVNTANVKISLSLDGGNSFPTVLAASTLNDGTETVIVPNTASTQARIKVEAVGNIFFDICNQNFTITAAQVLNTITTSAISLLTYCTGAPVNVSFTVNVNANNGNIYTAQLSNASGSFANPVSIGNLNAISSGTIAASLPAATPAGSAYRIRVVSSAPAVTGSDNAEDITINVAPSEVVISAGGPTTFCAGGNVILTGNSGGTWSVGGSTAANLTITTSGDYFVTSTNSCGSATSNHIIVNVIPLPNVTASNVTGCAGTPVILSGSPEGGSFSVQNPYTGPGTTYTYSYTNASGCTATSEPATITINPLPVVGAGTYAAVNTSSPAVALSGTPAGGTFSGTGVTGNSFNPSGTGAGTFTVSYVYTDANGCTASANTTITVNPAECVFTAGTIAGPANACPYMGPQDGDAAYSIAATNASLYNWVMPANVSIVSGQGTNAIVAHFTTSFVSGYIVVKITDACTGTVVVKNLSVRTTLPAIPGVIAGPTGACSYFTGAPPAVYTIRKVANSTSYIWTVPAGATITAHPGGTGPNDTIISVSYNNSFVSGTNITVRAASFCGAGTAARSLAISKSNPVIPGTIAGPTDVCPYAGTSFQVTYTVRTQPFAASYNWTVPANATIAARPGIAGTANDTIIKVVFNANFTSGPITVSAVNGCATSASRTLTISKSLPVIPSKIYGDPSGNLGSQTVAPQDACPFIFSGTNAVYSINRVRVVTDPSGYAAGYNWVLTDAINAQIVAHPGGTGANDTIIYVHFDNAFTAGSVQVQSLRNCGSSAFKSLPVTKKAPGTPAPISGNPSPCPSSIETYTVTAANAANYNWTVPSTASIISGQGSNTIQVQFLANFTGGPIKIFTTSACGTSSVRPLTLTKCAAFVRNTKGVVNRGSEDANTVFPNPSNGDFSLIVDLNANNRAALFQISNEFGQIVYQGRGICVNGIINLKLSDKLGNGIYFVHATINGKRITRKIIVSK